MLHLWQFLSTNRNNASESCEKKIIKKRMKMKEKWMVKTWSSNVHKMLKKL
jgi:hypothetical protein